MDPELVAQTLNFHGQQLTKIWETDRGAASLQANSLRDLDYQVYQKRSKDLGFQERGKRMRMHQFIVEKAPQLFNKAEKQTKDGVVWAFKSKDEDFVPLIPPLETFCRFDKIDSRANFFQSLRVGDVLMCQVQQKTFQGLVIRVIATDIGTRVRDVRELGIKGSIHPDHTISSTDRKDGQYNAGDLVRCEVIDLNADNEKLACGVKGIHHQGGEIQFGLVTKDQLPKSYRAMMEADGKSYEECFQSNRTFVNPSAVEHMARSFGLNTACTVSNSLLKGLNAPIPEKDNADELRKIQNGKWALKSVAEGIKYFKAGQETEAFQCLNKALHIDPLNVEGLVARGALYANKGSYDKAITDFELALKERPNHANATNYMSETLVAYAKQFEDEKNLDMAIQYYKKCLTVNPNHKEAQASLQVLMKRGHRPNFNIDFMEIENGKPKGDATVEGDDDRKSRRRKKESKKKRSGSSSSDSGSSSSSRFSSSGSDGSSRGRSKKRKSKKSKREASLSPFSKKQAQATLNPTSAPGANAGPALPPSVAGAYPSTEYPSIATRPHPVPPPYADRSFMAGNPPPPAFAGYGGVPAPTGVGYDKEVQSFIQRTALNEEYEKKVELFLQRVGTGKDGPKEKESEKEKDKKKKKKKDRSKDKKKSSKREKSKKDKKKKKRGSDDEDSDKIMSPQLSGLDELGELEAKLSAVYNKLAAKDSSKKKKKRKRHSSNSSNSSSSSGSSSDSDLERKKRKAKKALEDLAAAAALLRGGSEVVGKTGSSITPTKPEPVPPPSYGGASSSARMEDEDDDYGGKWRPMALKVNLGRASDEPQVEESRMVYMREERKSHQASQKAPVEPEDDLPPGEDRVSFKINSFGTFGPGNRQGMQKQASPPKPPADDSKHEEKGRDGSRSRSRSRGRGSRSRSRSRSGSRSYSRSRSRSGSRDRRRRTRSRSHSGDRRHARGYRGGNNHRYQNNNNNYHNNRGGRYIQRGGFQHRGRGWNNNNYNNNNNRGGYNNRPYNNRPYHNNNNNQGYDNRRRFDNNRGRNRGGYWEQRMQRSYSRSRSRSRSRSYTRSRSRSRSVTRSRSRSRENRGDRRETSPRQDQQQQQGGNNDRRTPDRRQSSPPPRKNEPSTPTQSAPPPPMPTLSASAERRRMGGKWDDRADEEEDLVPPGCE